MDIERPRRCVHDESYSVCVFISGVNGVWLSRHGVPLCSSWVFIRAFCGWQQNIWLGSGREFWESHGILDALTEHRLSALGPFPTEEEDEEEEEESCRSVCLCLCVCMCVVVVVVVGLRDILRELTQNNDRFTVQRQSGRQAHMWLKSKQRAGSLWALEQIWHIQIVQMISKAGNLYLCLRRESKVSAQLIYHLKNKKTKKNVKALKKEICEESLGLLYFGTTSFSHFLLMSNMQRFSRSTWELLLTELNDTIHIIAFLELTAVRPGVIPRRKKPN